MTEITGQAGSAPPQTGGVDDTQLAEDLQEERPGWLGLEAELQRMAADVGPIPTTPGSVAAMFDALTIISDLTRPRGGATLMQIHTFAYLACLLSLFDGRPAATWAYRFSAVPPTVPFSPSVQRAVDAADSSGLLRKVLVSPPSGESSSADAITPASPLTLTEAGQDELEFLAHLPSVAPRGRYLHAATGTSLTFPAPAVVNSLSADDQLWRALELKASRMLLEAEAVEVLHRQFEALSQVVGEHPADLLVPATVFVSFLDAELDRRVLAEGRELDD